jgi:hypothetical protein
MINQWRLSMRMRNGVADIYTAHPYLSFDADQCRCRMTMDYQGIAANTPPPSSTTTGSSNSNNDDGLESPDPLADWLLGHSPDTTPSASALNDWHHASTDWRCACSMCHHLCVAGTHVPIWYDPLATDNVQLTAPDALPVTMVTAITVALLPVLLAASSLCCALCYACADERTSDAASYALRNASSDTSVTQPLNGVTIGDETATATSSSSGYGSCYDRDVCPPTPEQWRWTTGSEAIRI